jgi:hypothetical protein
MIKITSKHLPQEANMATGVYRDKTGGVRVDYDGKYQMPMRKTEYENRGYKPPYGLLPTKAKFETGNRKKA